MRFGFWVVFCLAAVATLLDVFTAASNLGVEINPVFLRTGSFAVLVLFNVAWLLGVLWLALRYGAAPVASFFFIHTLLLAVLLHGFGAYTNLRASEAKVESPEAYAVAAAQPAEVKESSYFGVVTALLAVLYIPGVVSFLLWWLDFRRVIGIG